MEYCSSTEEPLLKKAKLESAEKLKEKVSLESLMEEWPDVSKKCEEESISSSELFRMGRSAVTPSSKCELESWQLQGFLDEDRHYAFCATITEYCVVDKMEDYKPSQYVRPIFEFAWVIIDTIEKNYYKFCSKDERFSSFIATLMRNGDMKLNPCLQIAVIEEQLEKNLLRLEEEENVKETNALNDLHWESHKCVWERVDHEISKETAHCIFFHLHLEEFTNKSSFTSETEKLLAVLELNFVVDEHPLLDGNHGRVHTGNCMSDYFSYYYPRAKVVSGSFELKRAADNYEIVNRNDLSGCLIWMSHCVGLSFPRSMEESAVLRQCMVENKQESYISETFNLHLCHSDYLSLHVRRVFDNTHKSIINKNTMESAASHETTESITNNNSKCDEFDFHNAEVTNRELTEVNVESSSYSIVESKKDKLARVYENDVTVESVDESQYRSTETGLLFPLSWNITTWFDDKFYSDLHVTSSFAKQEYVSLLSFPSRWEGCVEVDGILRAKGNNSNSSYSENIDDSTPIPSLSIHGYGIVRREHAGSEFDLNKFFTFVQSISINKLHAVLPFNSEIKPEENKVSIDVRESVTKHELFFSSNAKDEEQKICEKSESDDAKCDCVYENHEERKVGSEHVIELSALDKTFYPIWEIAAVSSEVTEIISTLSVLANMQEMCMCDEHKLMLSAFMGIYYYFYHIKVEEPVSNVRAALEWFCGKWVECNRSNNLIDSSATSSEAQRALVFSVTQKIDNNIYINCCNSLNKYNEETNNSKLESTGYTIYCEHQKEVDNTFVNTERCHCSEVNHQILCLRAFMLQSLEPLLRDHAILPFSSAVTALDLITPPWRWLDAHFNSFRSLSQDTEELAKVECIVSKDDKDDVKSLCSIPSSEQLSGQITDLEFTRLQAAMEGTWELIDTNRLGDDYDWILLLEGVSLQDRFYEFTNNATIIAKFITDSTKCIQFSYERLFSHVERLIYIEAAAWEWECTLRRCKVVSRACTQSYGDILFIESSISRVQQNVNDTTTLVERVWFTFTDSGRRMNLIMSVYDNAVDAREPLASCVRHYKLQIKE